MSFSPLILQILSFNSLPVGKKYDLLEPTPKINTVFSRIITKIKFGNIKRLAFELYKIFNLSQFIEKEELTNQNRNFLNGAR